MRIQFDCLVVIIGLVAGSINAYAAAVAAVSPTDTSVDSDEVLDEVVVKGTRLWELRAAVIKAEDRLIARYNELNRDDDFDIHCITHTPTGTHFSRRYCLSRLQDREQQKDAIAYIDWWDDTIIDPVTKLERHTNAPQPARETQVRMLERSGLQGELDHIAAGPSGSAQIGEAA